MTNGKRFFRPKPKTLIGTDFDSMLEKRIFDVYSELVVHHPPRIPYVQPRTYEPDFVVNCSEGQLVIETKGYFQDRSDCTKYSFVREALSEDNKTLVFVFENPDKPMHFQAKRKDGTKMTHAEWAIKNNFVAYPEWKFLELLSGGTDALYEDVMERIVNN